MGGRRDCCDGNYTFRQAQWRAKEMIFDEWFRIGIPLPGADDRIVIFGCLPVGVCSE